MSHEFWKDFVESREGKGEKPPSLKDIILSAVGMIEFEEQLASHI